MSKPNPGKGDAAAVNVASKDPYAEEIDDKRTALLDFVRDAHTRKSSMMNRVVLCGTMKKAFESSADATLYMQKIFHPHLSPDDLDNQTFSGLLVIYPSTWIHFIEGPPKAISGLLRDVAEHQSATPSSSSDTTDRHSSSSATSPHPYFGDAKVMAYQDDIPARAFTFWHHIFATPASENDMDDAMFQEDVFPETVSKAVLEMISIGTQLSSLKKLELKEALDAIPDRFKDTLPSNELLRAFVKQPLADSVEEWLHIYAQHQTLVLDEELVWPVAKLIDV